MTLLNKRVIPVMNLKKIEFNNIYNMNCLQGMKLLKENQIEEQLDIEKMKLENNEDQAKERIRIAEEKIAIQTIRNFDL